MSPDATPAPAPGRWESAARQASVRRLTWAMVLTAFVVWIILATIAARWGIQALRFGSAPVPTTIERVSGVVLSRQPDGSRDASADVGTQLYEHDDVITSFGSSADLRFFDGSLVQLFPDSRLEITAARIGRFNPGPSQVSFTLMAGAIRMTVPQVEDKSFTVKVATPFGSAAFVPGDYTVRVSGAATRISVWDGRTAAAVAGETIEVSPGRKIVLGLDPSGYRIVDAMENVLTNGAFTAGFDSWEFWEEREEGRPDVSGEREIVQPAETGAPPFAARFTRTSALDTHNETGLRQVLNQDVNGARSIVLHALVKVDAASLSGGGYLGTEYPMMLRIRYRDSRGVDQVWETGFYSANAENRPVPLGEQIQQGVWTEYSVDLAQFKPPPEVIGDIEVFGAGHTFDASIADVELLVD